MIEHGGNADVVDAALPDILPPPFEDGAHGMRRHHPLLFH